MFNLEMNHHSLFIVHLLLLTTSFNHGEKINLMSKINQRRAAGIFAQPRVGRAMDITSFERADGTAGLVQYPRVGRSNLPWTLLGINNPSLMDITPELQNHDSDIIFKLDGQDIHDNINEDNPKKIERLISNEDAIHQVNKNNDEAWNLFFLRPIDFSKLKRQSAYDYIQKLSREIDHA